MKQSVLYAYDKARKVIDSMDLIQSCDIDTIWSIVHNTFHYVELFGEMYSEDNFYYEDLLNRYFKKKHEVVITNIFRKVLSNIGINEPLNNK